VFVCLFLARQPPVGQGLLIQVVSRSHTTTHYSRWDSSGRVNSSSQRTLPDNTQHSQETEIHASVRFEPIISAGERPQIYALDLAANGIFCPLRSLKLLHYEDQLLSAVRITVRCILSQSRELHKCPIWAETQFLKYLKRVEVPICFNIVQFHKTSIYCALKRLLSF